jgi:hypothetical protein
MMTEDPTPKPKAAKKSTAKKKETSAPLQGAESKSPAWSVITLAFLIGGGLIAAVSFTFLRTNPFVGGNESDTQLRAVADRVAQVEGQKSRLDALENSISRFETTRNSLAALQEKEESDVHRLESAMNELRAESPAKANLAPIEGRMTALEQKVQNISQTEFSEKERLLALALSGLALKNALDTGGPFAPELAVVKNLLHAQSNLEALGDYAETGLATSSALLSRYPETAQAILNSQTPQDADIWTRTKSFFHKFVDVRKVGNVSGNDLDAVIARIEYDLQQNDSTSALKEFQSLPEQARQSAGAWGNDLAARARADHLIRDLLLTTAQNLRPQRPPKAE